MSPESKPKSAGKYVYYSSRRKGEVSLTQPVTEHGTALGAHKELGEYGCNPEEWEVVRVEVTPV